MIDSYKMQGADDLAQIFIIRPLRSWTTLNISLRLFKELMNNYGIFSRFWGCVFTFGRKHEENEIEFPEFVARRSPGGASHNVTRTQSTTGKLVLIICQLS
jgi:hypothetical protein